jgi:hypothetical protein
VQGSVSDIYFLFLVLFGAYWILNLVVAIMNVKFEAAKEEEEEKVKQRKLGV